MGIGDIYARGRAVAGGRPAALAFGLVLVLLFVDLVTGLATGDIAATTVAVFVWQGLLIGFIVGLAGIGLSMVYDILTFPHFAHGDLLSAGAFGGWIASFLMAGLGQFGVGTLVLLGLKDSAVGPQSVGISVTSTPLAVLVGLAVAAAVTAALALALDHVVYRPMRDSSGIALLIASIGVAFILRYTLATVFGTDSLGLVSGANVPSVTVPVVSLSVDVHEVTLLVATVSLMLGLHVFLQRTTLGMAMRAMSDNRSLAQVTGVPIERVVRITWAIGASLTGVAGYLLVLERGTIAFDFGWLLLLLIFAGVILGGIGSIYGAIAGGIVIGLASRLSIVWIPAGFVNAAAFAIMIVVLYIRPRGLFEGVSTT